MKRWRGWTGIAVGVLALVFGAALVLGASGWLAPAPGGEEVAGLALQTARGLEAKLDERWRALRELEAGFAPEMLADPRANSAWMDARLQRVPGAVWMGVADQSGIVRAETREWLAGSEVSDRAWFRHGVAGPVVPREAAFLPRPSTVAGELDARRLFALAVPLHDREGAVVGRLAAYFSLDRLTVEVVDTLRGVRAPLRVVVSDRAGAEVFGFSGLTSGFNLRSENVPVGLDGPLGALGWRVRVEEVSPVAGTAWVQVVLGATALAAVLFWIGAGAVRGRGGLRGRAAALAREVMLALGMLLAAVVLGGIELRGAEEGRRLERRGEAAARTLLQSLLDGQRARFANVRSLQVLIGDLSDHALHGEQAALAVGLSRLLSRIAERDVLGTEVIGLAADGRFLWSSAPGVASSAVLAVERAAAAVRAGAVRAYGTPTGTDGPAYLPVAGGVHDLDGRLESIAVVMVPTATFDRAVRTQGRMELEKLAFDDGGRDVLALARADGPILFRSDGLVPPGAMMPNALLRAIAAAGEAPVRLKAGDSRTSAGHLILAGRAIPGGLVAIVSFDIGGRRAALAREIDRTRGLGLLAVALLLAAGQVGRLWRRGRMAGRDALMVAEAARGSERFLRGVIDNLQAGLMLIDPQGVVRFVNRRQGEVLGLPDEAMVGRDAKEIAAQTADMGIAERFARARAGESVARRRFALPGPEGAERLYDGELHLLSATAEEGLGGWVIATAQDVTALAQAEAAQLLAEQQVRQMLAAMPGALLEFAWGRQAVAGAVLYCSESMRRLSGYTVEEVLAQGWWGRAMEGADAREVAARLAESGTMVRDMRLRRADGRVLVLHVNAMLLRDGETRRVFAYFSDVTEVRQAEARLDEIARGAFLASVAVGFSHEINQPLTIISTALQNLAAEVRHKLPEDAAVGKRIQRVVDAALRIGRLTEEFRGLSLAVGTIRAVRLEEEAAVVVAEMLPRAAEAGVGIVLEVAAGIAPALGDAMALRWVIGALIENALRSYAAAEAAEAAGWVVVRVIIAGEAEMVVLMVEDAAGAIPAGLLEQVFEPYARVRTAAVNGTLEMVRCRGIVAAMHGAVAVACDGNVVRHKVTLPRAWEADGVVVAVG